MPFDVVYPPIFFHCIVMHECNRTFYKARYLFDVCQFVRHTLFPYLCHLNNQKSASLSKEHHQTSHRRVPRQRMLDQQYHQKPQCKYSVNCRLPLVLMCFASDPMLQCQATPAAPMETAKPYPNVFSNANKMRQQRLKNMIATVSLERHPPVSKI